MAYVQSLDYDSLQQAADRLPYDSSLVVGLGGGRAIDAAKHVAVAKDMPLIQVPTIVSSGALVHGYCGRYVGRTAVGDRDDWVWADCEYVLVDYGLVLAAPAHLNTAGLGDVLCERSGISEWRHAGTGDASEAEALAALEGFHRRVVAGFPATLSDGELTSESVRSIMQTLQRRDENRILLDSAPAVDHSFLAALEQANDREWIHGEIVALGALIVAWQCGDDPDRFAAELDACLIRRRPSALRIGPDQLRRGLDQLVEDLSSRPAASEYGSVMRAAPVEGERFAELWSFLERAA